ncbi:MAG: hypothetical protein MHM6MM_008668 [Cercozoa sp. M6MM]
MAGMTNTSLRSMQCAKIASVPSKHRVDRARIDRIIHEASRNSAHYKNEARKAAEVSVRIKRVKRELAALPPSEREKLERDAVRLRDQLDAERDDLDRVWIAVDMDQVTVEYN